MSAPNPTSLAALLRLRFLRALGRAFRTDRWEAHATGAVHCANCGHRAVAVVPVASPCYNAETGLFDILECPECGLFTMCSD